MRETLYPLRDHAYPCEHKSDRRVRETGTLHMYTEELGSYVFEGLTRSWWACGSDDCPGGRKLKGRLLEVPRDGGFTSMIQGGYDENNRIEVGAGRAFLVIDLGWISEIS